MPDADVELTPKPETLQSDEVVTMLRELLHSSLSEASRKLYSRAWVLSTQFYRRYQSVQLTLPVSTACVALFVCAKGLSLATINSYLSAIAYVHKIQGHNDPTKSFLIEKLLLAGGRRSQVDIRLPISPPLWYKLNRAGSRSYQYICLSAFPLCVHVHDIILRVLWIRRIGVQTENTIARGC